MMVRSLALPTSLGPWITGLVDGWLFNGVQLASAALIVVYGRRQAEERTAWTVIAAGVAVWCFGNIWWSLFLDPDELVLPPSIPDAFWLSSYPILFVGIVKLLRCRLSTSVSPAAALDGAIAGTAVSAIVSATVLNTIVQGGSGSAREVIFGVIYPVFDVALLGLIAGMGLTVGRGVLRSLGPLVAGLVLFVFADTAYYLLAALGKSDTRGWDTLWTLALAILALAPLAKRTRSQPTNLRFGSIVAATAGASSLGVLLAGNFTKVGIFAVAFATSTIVLVMVRVAASFKHHQTLLTAQSAAALTDPLTHLANRRQFMSDLADRAIEQGPATMAMIDLDGFKLFNDTHGHLVGDDLLVRFARLASHAVGGFATLYRLGGDEFCVVADQIPSDPSDQLDRRLQSLAHDPNVGIQFSFGTVTLWSDGLSIHESLALADRRLYEHKRSPKPQNANEPIDDHTLLVRR